MSLLLDAAGPPPHLHQIKSVSWPSPYNPHDYPAPASSPGPMSPQSLQSYMSHMSESPLPSQEINHLPTSSWYGPSVSAPECHNQNGYAAYGQYLPPHTSSIALSQPAPYHYSGKSSVSTARIETSVAAMSPVSTHGRDSVLPESTRPSEEPQTNSTHVLEQSTGRWRPNPHLLNRPNSSSSSLHSGPVDSSWTMNPLGIQTNNLHHDQFYPNYQHLTPSPRMSERLMDIPSHHQPSPSSRRLYTPIAPQPLETPRSSVTKRSREEDDDHSDEIKRRKRSDSNNSAQFELSEEDKLLLQLKEEESMPWKDIAARFQTDLGKSYQIPALQMRLKRLRERMRVWTETDVRALRMAHEYWVQNKFDIISQKMLEFGAQEKWTSRQCARKWAEIDPAPTPYAHFEHLQHGFAPYSMSPVEAPHTFLPYMNVQ
ncbi:hypothetical protein CC86DRAFT_448249 [Ophiobolus disseminans]|uniref:Myb-like domain-containing protein n=1 Tax=Ophiobolus disseminans TaxID=1469910 RepID=A0A6A6ZNM3_9PLEO|nr:hypothetical protein CC86DRAFT_448249 [Ophiobolus disseminans]